MIGSMGFRIRWGCVLSLNRHIGDLGDSISLGLHLSMCIFSGDSTDTWIWWIQVRPKPLACFDSHILHPSAIPAALPVLYSLPSLLPHPGHRPSFLTWAIVMVSKLVSLFLPLPCSFWLFSEQPEHNTPWLKTSSGFRKTNLTYCTCRIPHICSIPTQRWLFSCLTASSLACSFQLLEPPHYSSNISDSFLPQAICTSCFFCLDCFPFRYQHCSLSHLLSEIFSMTLFKIVSPPNPPHLLSSHFPFYFFFSHFPF